jgi:hypothetical protein
MSWVEKLDFWHQPSRNFSARQGIQKQYCRDAQIVNLYLGRNKCELWMRKNQFGNWYLLNKETVI